MADQGSNTSRASLVAWLLPVAVTGVAAAAVVGYTRSGESHAAAGSPYYQKAVQEAIAGLKNVNEKSVPAAAIPALPEGLSPEDNYCC